MSFWKLLQEKRRIEKIVDPEKRATVLSGLRKKFFSAVQVDSTLPESSDGAIQRELALLSIPN